MRLYLTAALLLFVSASVVYMIVTETHSSPELSASSRGGAMQTGPAGLPPPSTNPEQAEEIRPEVVVYYFHGNVRCKKCLAMEEYAKEAVEGFGTSQEDRVSVVWRVINYDDPAHEHFVNDFGLTSSSVVVVRTAGPEHTEYKILEKTWDLVSDKEAFKVYVVAETLAMLEPAS